MADENLDHRMTKIESDQSHVIQLLQEVRADVKAIPGQFSERIHGVRNQIQAHLVKQDEKIENFRDEVRVQLGVRDSRIDKIESAQDKQKGAAWAIRAIWGALIATLAALAGHHAGHK